MAMTVSIMFADNTPIDAGVTLNLLDGTAVVANAVTATGSVTFAVDPSGLKQPAIQLTPDQTPPTAH